MARTPVLPEATLGALSAQLRRPRPRFAMSGSRRLRPVDVEDFLCRNLRHDRPRHFWIKPANTVGANDKIGWIENVTLDEIQHRAINVRPFRLH